MNAAPEARPEDAVVVEWLRHADEDLREQLHRVVTSVVELGGAVGWLEVPDRSATDAWLATTLTQVAGGRGGLAVARVAGRVEALGAWSAGPVGPVGHVAELHKIMAHPAARGMGLGRRIVTELVRAVDAAGQELAVLGVRGNNHAAIRLYEECGFHVWGVLPAAVAVGNLRFDDVRMFRPLRRPEGTVLHGSAPGGPGS